MLVPTTDLVAAKRNMSLRNKSEVTDHPAFGGFQGDRPVAVHGRLEKLPGADVPEQDEADPGPDGQNVALEGDGSDSAAVVPRRNFLDGLKRSGRQNESDKDMRLGTTDATEPQDLHSLQQFFL